MYSDAQTQCPDGFTYAKGSCYMATSLSYNYFDGIRICESRSAHMVSVTSLSEHHWMIERILDSQGFSGSYAWIGLNSIYNSSVFSWLDGSELNYTGWGYAQPNDNYDWYHCVLSSTSATPSWTVTQCSNRYPVICEWSGNFTSSGLGEIVFVCVLIHIECKYYNTLYNS